MKKWIRNTLAALAVTGVLTGCGLQSVAATNTATTTTTATATASAGTAAASAAEVLAANQESHSTDDDLAVADTTAAITLNGSSATAEGTGVSVNGNVITITTSGTYRITGTLTEGQIVVNSTGDGNVTLVLDGAQITSSTTAPIAVQAADEVVVQLADGTTNTLTASAAQAPTNEADPNAALWSKADLTIAGTGSLTVTSRATDGIAGADGLVVESGTITVKAADDALRGKDYVIVNGGAITADAGGDALTATNETEADRGYVSVTGGTLKLTSGNDGISGFTDVVLTGGTITVTSGGGSSGNPDDGAKGVVAGANLVLEGAELSVDSADDALHSDSVATIASGRLTASTGDDGVHAETSLTVKDGTVTVNKATEGLESAAITINGGTIELTTSDDGINVADGSGAETGPQGTPDSGLTYTQTGGTITVNSAGDGLDVNGSVAMSGGTLLINGPSSNGNGAMDVDGTFSVTGGTLLALGSSGMAMAPATDSEQAWVSFTLDQTLSAGTVVHIVSDGKVIASTTLTGSVQSVVYSSDAIKTDTSYELWTGGTAAEAGKTGSLDGATKTSTVTSRQHTASRGPGGR